MQNILKTTSILALGGLITHAGQFDVNLFPMKVAGQKAIIKMQMVNHLSEPVSSAKAACFISDESGQVVAHSSRWVFGGTTTNSNTMPVGATNIFNFVVNSTKPFGTNHLSAKLVFSRIVLKSGMLANPAADVQTIQKQ